MKEGGDIYTFEFVGEKNKILIIRKIIKLLRTSVMRYCYVIEMCTVKRYSKINPTVIYTSTISLTHK
jgi:hypothetical protein